MAAPRHRPETTHDSLGPEFQDPVRPARFPETRLRFRNDRWAARIGLEGLSEAGWIEHFARFEPLPGSFPQPLALRYHGHQFRAYNSEIGDGRGLLFAQLRDLEDGRLLDLGTVPVLNENDAIADHELRYGDNDYFWVNDLQAKMIMHPVKPELNGKDMSDFKDPNGVRPILEAANVAREKGSGFVHFSVAVIVKLD